MTEILRRSLVWLGVAAFFGSTMSLAMVGEWTGLIGFSAFPVVGAIILTSRPRNGVGWYLWAVGVYWVLLGWSLHPQLVAGVPAWFESLGWTLAGPFWLLLPIVGLLFPTGRIETRLGVVLAWLLVGFATLSGISSLISDSPLASGRPNPFAVTMPSGLEIVFDTLVFPAWVVVLAGVVIDLARRWRVADQTARAQYRWFFLGLGSLAGVLSLVVLSNLVPPIADMLEAAPWIALLIINLVPITIGIAITRHGLYEIGRVVSRTVSYAAATVLAIGVYALVVTSVSLLLPVQSAIPVALATLAAAALFLPFLRWVQRRLDRRFDRERYDAEKVVDAFGQRLRTGADPASTVPELVHAVERTLQPVSLGIWTRGEVR